LLPLAMKWSILTQTNVKRTHSRRFIKDSICLSNVNCWKSEINRLWTLIFVHFSYSFLVYL
jgi:hypothetical protein